MQRSKKRKIKLNDTPALENLLQEVYTDACNQITEVNILVHNLDTMVSPDNVDDLAKIAKEKTSALKLKDSAARLKLDISKMMNEVIKQNGELESKPESLTDNMFADNSAFDAIRDLIKQEEIDNKK